MAYLLHFSSRAIARRPFLAKEKRLLARPGQFRLHRRGSKIYNVAMAVKVCPIETGEFWVDGGAMFGVVPRVLWERQYKPDDKNRIRQTMRVLLIIDGDRNILVDVGAGNWHEAKFIRNYGLENEDFDFDVALKDYGLSTDDITDTILTHLHFDHAGGWMRQKGGELVPTFGQARAWVQKDQLAWAQEASPIDRASYMEAYLKPLTEWPQLEVIDGEHQITENVSVIPVHGHTPAMQTVLARNNGERHFFPSDLVPTAGHVHIPYIAAYDHNTVMAGKEKQLILELACDEEWMIYFCHDPDVAKGQVIQEKGKFTIKTA